MLKPPKRLVRRARTVRARTTEHRTPRKEEILDGAAELIAAHGFEAVSMADIAAAVGLSKTTLYHYFDRKEQILGTIVVTAIRELNEFVAAAVPATLAPDEKLIAFMEAQAEFFERRRTYFEVLLTQFGSLSDAQTRDAAVEWRVRYENAIRRIVQEGVDKGVFAAERPNSVLRAVLASLYWLVRWYRPDGTKPARLLAREYAQLLLHGVAIRQESRPGARRAA